MINEINYEEPETKIYPSVYFKWDDLKGWIYIYVQTINMFTFNSLYSFVCKHHMVDEKAEKLLCKASVCLSSFFFTMTKHGRIKFGNI